MNWHSERIAQGELRLTLGTKNARKVEVESQFDSKKKRTERRGRKEKTKGSENWGCGEPQGTILCDGHVLHDNDDRREKRAG